MSSSPKAAVCRKGQSRASFVVPVFLFASAMFFCVVFVMITFLQKHEISEFYKERARAKITGKVAKMQKELDISESNATASVTLPPPYSRRGRFRPKPKIGVCPAGVRKSSFEQGEMDTLFAIMEQREDLKSLQPFILHRDPWIVQFENFMTADEVAAVLGEIGNNWSPDITATTQDHVLYQNNLYRNSSSWNCDHLTCGVHVQRLRQRMADVLRIGDERGDGFTVLKYEPGGFYRKHHDYILKEIDSNCWNNCGPRVMTFMVYMRDIEAGGETDFFHLDLKVRPKLGRAILWPDTFPHSPLDKDERTAHQACTVIKGTKIAGTQWFHQFDFDSNKQAKCC